MGKSKGKAGHMGQTISQELAEVRIESEGRRPVVC